MPYVYVEYPKYKYHASKEPVLVQDKSEEDALGKSWHNHPVSKQESPKKVSAPKDAEGLKS